MNKSLNASWNIDDIQSKVNDKRYYDLKSWLKKVDLRTTNMNLLSYSGQGFGNETSTLGEMTTEAEMQ